MNVGCSWLPALVLPTLTHLQVLLKQEVLNDAARAATRLAKRPWQGAVGAGDPAAQALPVSVLPAS